MKILSFDVGVKNLAMIVLDVDNEYLENLNKSKESVKKNKKEEKKDDNDNDKDDNDKDDKKKDDKKKDKNSLTNIDTEKIKIIDWRIINLMEEFNEEKPCCYIEEVKKRKSKKKASIDLNQNDIVIIEPIETKNCKKMSNSSVIGNFYCTKHSKLVSKELVFDNIFEENPIDDTKSSNKCSYTNCKVKKVEVNYKLKKEFENIPKIEDKNNILLCKTHHKTFKNNHTKMIKINKTKLNNFNNTNIDEIKLNLWLRLDKLPDLLDVDYVIIENQPVLRNPRMKTISESLYNYFLCRGIVDKERTNSIIQAIKYINPSNKLKMEKDNSISVLKGSTSKTKYKLTKSLAVEYTKNLLEKYPDFQDIFNSAKKKDDLADCFLQGLYYIYFIHKPHKDDN